MHPDSHEKTALLDCLDDFVSYKRGLGYAFGGGSVNSYRQMAAYIDGRPGHEGVAISQEDAFDWIANGGSDHPRTRARRASVVRVYAEYLVRCGYSGCYVLPKEMMPEDATDFVPHIFTHAEIEAVTRILDEMERKAVSPLRHLVFPAMWRVIYGCGLRSSEATRIKVGDVDLDQGVLLVRSSKNEDGRYIPMSESLTAYLGRYVEESGVIGCADDGFFFPSPAGGAYSKDAVSYAFRNAFVKAGVENQRGRPPRVHDARHTFAVHSLQQAAERGVPAHAFLPALAVFMGHKHIRYAEYYLHLTAEGQDLAIAKMMSAYAGLYKEVYQHGAEED